MRRIYTGVLVIALSGCALAGGYRGIGQYQRRQLPVQEIVQNTPDFKQNTKGVTSDRSKEQLPDPSCKAEESTTEKNAFLTFDDGPGEWTSSYLDLLSRYHAKATFFLIGEQITEDTIPVVQRELKEGHEIGVHTYTHEAGQIYASAESYFKDVCRVRARLEETFDYTPKLWRFPWGSANCYICGYKKELVDRLEKEGMEYADWNVSAEDSVGSPTIESILQNIRKDCFRVEDPVILMHDSNSNKTTLDALESVLSLLLEQGYQFKTLSERKKPCHFGG